MYELYELEHCPYCLKVIGFMNTNGIEYVKHDISNPQEEETLIRLGGKRQVPFLYEKSTGLKMYESGDIIEYLSASSSQN